MSQLKPHALCNARLFFFFLLLTACNFANAQDFPAKALWLRSDIGTEMDRNRVSRWWDQSGNLNNASAQWTPTVDFRPLFQISGGNFNPTLYFDGTDQMDIPYTNILNGTNVNVFSVHQLTGGTSWRSPFTSRDDSPVKGYILYVDPYGKYQLWNGNGGYGTWQALRSSRWASSKFELISFIGNRAGLNTLRKTGYANGTRFVGPVNHRYIQNTQRPYRVGGGATESINGAYRWVGNISEQIVFNTALTTQERQITESYLAIKYGLSLGNNTTAISYLRGDGTSVWDASTEYRFDVAGIGREDQPFNLHQRISSSVNSNNTTSSNLTIASSNDFTTSNLNPARRALVNGQFLLWGHNNQATNNWINDGCLQRVARFWRMQNTNNTGIVFLEINLRSYPASPTGEYALIIDNDTDLSNGITASHPLIKNGNLYSCEMTPENGTSFFTIGVADTTPPVFVNCPENINECSNSIINWEAPTVTDNCWAPRLTCDETPGKKFPVGETTITYTATDFFGNTAECSFTITIHQDPEPKGIFHE